MADEHNFFALISRMKYIDRWALMRNTETGEHSGTLPSGGRAGPRAGA